MSIDETEQDFENEAAMPRLPIILALGAALALAGCNSRTDDPSGAEPAPSDSAGPDRDAPVSIIRSDVEQPDLPATPLEPLTVTIGFPAGGTELDAAATAALELALASRQVSEGGVITLRAHSDAGGTEAANLRASNARGEQVKDWLVNKGIEESRITVIAFGEQNPVEPNALPDGTPNEAGRAANRRVEITVSAITPDAPPIMEPAEPAN